MSERALSDLTADADVVGAVQPAVLFWARLFGVWWVARSNRANAYNVCARRSVTRTIC